MHQQVLRGGMLGRRRREVKGRWPPGWIILPSWSELLRQVKGELPGMLPPHFALCKIHGGKYYHHYHDNRSCRAGDNRRFIAGLLGRCLVPVRRWLDLMY